MWDKKTEHPQLPGAVEHISDPDSKPPTHSGLQHPHSPGNSHKTNQTPGDGAGGRPTLCLDGVEEGELVLVEALEGAVAQG